MVILEPLRSIWDRPNRKANVLSAKRTFISFPCRLAGPTTQFGQSARLSGFFAIHNAQKSPVR